MKVEGKIIFHKLLTEYISDTKPSLEGHLINHMNESLDSDLKRYSNNVKSQTKYENASTLTITKARQLILIF